MELTYEEMEALVLAEIDRHRVNQNSPQQIRIRRMDGRKHRFCSADNLL